MAPLVAPDMNSGVRMRPQLKLKPMQGIQNTRPMAGQQQMQPLPVTAMSRLQILNLDELQFLKDEFKHKTYMGLKVPSSPAGDAPP